MKKPSILIGVLLIAAVALTIYNYVDIMAMPTTPPPISQSYSVPIQDTDNPQQTMNATELQGE